MSEASEGFICVLTSVHPPFDTRVFHRQARSTAAAGFAVLLIAPGAPRGTRDGVRFQSIPAWGGRAARPLRWPVLFWKAIRAKADIYHFHDPELLPWGVLLRLVTRRPVIYDSHEYLVEDIEAKRWIPARLRRPVARAAGWVERWSTRRLSAVVAVTDEMADRFRPIQPRTVTVRNLPPLPSHRVEPTERQPHVAYAGLMNIERGLDILFETARLVHARRPEAEFRILGSVEWDGLPTAERDRSQSAWKEVGVRFLPPVPAGDVAGIIGDAAIGWVPRSPDYANNLLAWPNKLVEYMVLGLPIVASDLPLQARLVREEDCGIVVAPVSPQAHADAICDLLDNSVEARRLGENGRRAALEKYTWEFEARRLHLLYKELRQMRTYRR